MTDVKPFNAFDSAEFRKELTELLDEKLSPLVTKVAEHEKVIQQSKGAMWVFAGMWTLIVSVVTGLSEYLLHRRHP